MKIILISGPSGAGKSTVAEMMRDIYGYKIFPLADTIKRGVASITGLTLEEIEVKKNDLTSEVRTALQSVGESACEKNPNHWVDLTWSGIKDSMYTYNQGQRHNFVIPDLRKPYEKEFFEKLTKANDRYQTLLHIHINRNVDTSLPKFQHKTESFTNILRGSADVLVENNFDTVEEFLYQVNLVIFNYHINKGIIS